MSFELAVIFGVAALFYAVVGHGGASAYLAVMALAGFAPEVMRPNALLLNVVVSAVATLLFLQGGHFRWNLFWPFAVSAIPMAMLGGMVILPPGVFHALVGGSLVVAAWRLFLPSGHEAKRGIPPLALALLTGAAIGLLSGLVGVGGGIFLTPLLLLAGWCGPKEAAAVSAPFILLNSLAGLAGMAASGSMTWSPALPVWAAACLLGGLAGAAYGSRWAAPIWLRTVLGLVLLLAAAKFGLQSWN